MGTWGLLLRSLELVSEGDKEPLENVTGSECLSSKQLCGSRRSPPDREPESLCGRNRDGRLSSGLTEKSEPANGRTGIAGPPKQRFPDSGASRCATPSLRSGSFQEAKQGCSWPQVSGV
ncbi:hypothetical protein PAL_GLEAN10005526 [Pteropus alecto]|uniref:Uncharacterized protein n=1 Tax=Pteropus alecto TaxID=9402 RepID=L5JUA3_PTEAL|nr:hypothetical protein PAL_GLEAN10005526 [Pteropus alecto]